MAVYAAIRQLGANGIAGMIERCCSLASELVEGIGALPGVQVESGARLNQGLVRFLDPSSQAADEDHDRFTDTAIEGIQRGGEAFFTGTDWHGRRCMRVFVCNWMTTESDVRRAISAVAEALQVS